jgi:hypothetical protein
MDARREQILRAVIRCIGEAWERLAKTRQRSRS